MDNDQVMVVLRKELWDYCDHSHLSKVTGLSYPCIRNIAKGKTKWPQLNTFNALCSALNLQLILVKKE